MESFSQVLDGVKADAVIVTDPYNVRYVSGFRGGEATLFITFDKKILITDSRYTEAAKKESAFKVIEWNRENPKITILNELISSENVLKLAFEDEAMMCNEFNELKDKLPDFLEWIPVKNKINNLRMIKKPWELECLKKAESIGDAAFAKILEFLKPGVSELDVVAELEYQMRKCGGEGTSFDTIVASGLHSSMPHAIPDTKKLELGDFVTMDFGCKYNGYCSDMTRTVVIGKANDEQKKIYDTVLKANLLVLEQVHAGMKGCEVDKIARDFIEKAGYGKCFGHGLGHSVGLFIHENPRFSPSESAIIKAGMVETVEPGIYVPGFGGVRIEDMIVVTENGYENFAHSPKELIQL